MDEVPMAERRSQTIEGLEGAFAQGGGPSALALVGDDGYLVAVAARTLVSALEAGGLEVRESQADPVALADDLRAGALFGKGIAFLVEDPDWLLGATGERRKRLVAIARAVREGKGTPAKRLVELLVSSGARWDPLEPANALETLDEWLDEAAADQSTTAALRELIAQAARERLELPKTTDPVGQFERAIDGLAPGNRIILTLSSRPPKNTRVSSILSRFDVLSVELPPGEISTVLSRMAQMAARDEGVRFAPGALEILVGRTSPKERLGARDRDSEGSIRLFRSELDKLLQAAGPSGLVTTELASSLVSETRAAIAWEIDGHLVARDPGAAIQKLRRLLPKRHSQKDEAGDELATLSYLGGLFRKILAIHGLLGPAEVRQAGRASYSAWKTRWLPILAPLLAPGRKDYPLYKATQMATSFTAPEAIGALRRLAAIDESAKLGGVPLREQLEDFLLAVVPRGREERNAGR